MRLILFFVSMLLLTHFASKGQAGFNTSPSGLKYRMFTHENGPKPKLGDFVKFNFILYSQKDSVLSSTYRSLFPVVAEIRAPTYNGDLEGAFMMMSKGDSGIFLVSADSFYFGQDNMPVPTGSTLKMRIKMIDIESPEQYALEMQKDKDETVKITAEVKIQEIKRLDEYIKNKEPKAIKTPEGLYYVIDAKGKGPFPKDSQTVVISYKLHLLNGRAIDGESAQIISFVMGRHEVIQGLEMGVKLLNKGSKARLFIPSSLGYGLKGRGDLIHPYTTLIYDNIDILEIK